MAENILSRDENLAPLGLSDFPGISTQGSRALGYRIPPHWGSTVDCVAEKRIVVERFLQVHPKNGFPRMKPSA
jgi:hypothetical protein